jgi:hypothetical protein
MNPREVEHKILKWVDRIMRSDDKDMFDTEDYLDRLEALAKEDLTRTQTDQLKGLAETIYNKVNGIVEEPTRGRGGKDVDMIPETMKKQVRLAMTRGYLTNTGTSDKRHYGISRENIASVFCDEEYNEEDTLNREMLERLIRKLEADGAKFKYETDAEFLKDGLSDPSEE